MILLPPSSRMYHALHICSLRLQQSFVHPKVHSELFLDAVGGFSNTAFASGTSLRRCSTPRSVAARATLSVEANLFGRFFRVIRSYANSFVSGAEDPEKILDQAVVDLQGDLIKMRQASAQVLASQKQMQAKYDQSKEAGDQWFRRAQMAVEKGQDELAREALTRKKAYEDNARSMKAQLDAQTKASDQLKANMTMLDQKLSEAKSKKDTLKARAKSAQTSKQIQEMVQGLNTSNAMAAFDRMEEKVMALEAESEATLQLSDGDQLESKFRQMEGGDVDEELNRMKRGLPAASSSSSNSSSNSSGNSNSNAGRPVRDAIDFELEELRRKARE
ncbi:hypothetical protein WJX84_005974 [Apatococcus fuscideae]|uniref:Uncharacterized protein n=1 Tax=Apatococcus fuscideae TaxID=2026836 RepID=A0AAW1T8X4_9CHLO